MVKHIQVQLDGSGGLFNVIAETSRSQVAAMTLSSGQTTGGPNNKHAESDQWLYVISGAGEAVVAGKSVDLSKGSLLLIEAGETHEISNSSDEPLQTINIYAPPEY